MTLELKKWIQSQKKKRKSKSFLIDRGATFFGDNENPSISIDIYSYTNL